MRYEATIHSTQLSIFFFVLFFFCGTESWFCFTQMVHYILISIAVFALATTGGGIRVHVQAMNGGRSPSCNGCFSMVNGVSYACCDNMLLNNGICTCDGNFPCKQCSPSAEEKETSSPACGDCYSSLNGVTFTCEDCSISLNNTQCVCGDGSSCIQCSPPKNNLISFGVGPCGGLLTPNGPAVIPQAGLCVPAGSVVAQLSFYDVSSGTLTPANITIPANPPSTTYFALQAQWSGAFGWRNVQVCLCEDPNCNGGQQLCSPAYGHGQNWEWNQWGLINIPHTSIAVQNLLFGFFG